MNTNEYIGNQIRNFRRKSKYSRDDIADKLNISTSAYGRLETGKSLIDSSRIYQLCTLFEVPLRSFFPPLKNPKEEAVLNEVAANVQELLRYQEKLLTSKDELILARNEEIEHLKIQMAKDEKIALLLEFKIITLKEKIKEMKGKLTLPQKNS